jgi:predicted secreted Zn-dependent protease
MTKFFLLMLSIIILGFGGQANAEMLINAKVKYFDIKANDPKDLLRKLRLVKSPIWGDAFAWIHSDTQNGTTFETDDSGCQMHSIQSEVDITITLPRWINVKDRVDRHQKWWAKLIAFIIEHENQHKDIIIKTARDFQQAVKAIGVKQDCGTVRDAYYDIKFQHARMQHARDFKLDFSVGGRLAIKNFLFLESLPEVKSIKTESNSQNENKK